MNTDTLHQLIGMLYAQVWQAQQFINQLQETIQAKDAEINQMRQDFQGLTESINNGPSSQSGIGS